MWELTVVRITSNFLNLSPWPANSNGWIICPEVVGAVRLPLISWRSTPLTTTMVGLTSSIRARNPELVGFRRPPPATGVVQAGRSRGRGRVWLGFMKRMDGLPEPITGRSGSDIRLLPKRVNYSIDIFFMMEIGAGNLYFIKNNMLEGIARS